MAILQALCVVALIAAVAGDTAEEKDTSKVSSLWDNLAKELAEKRQHPSKGYSKSEVDDDGNASAVAVGKDSDGSADRGEERVRGEERAPKRPDCRHRY